jgi:hypothetical protein
MNLAEAVPAGAKQFGSKTASKMKTEELKQISKNTSDQKTSYKKNSLTHKDKSTIKNEQIKSDIKLKEVQKAQEKFQKTFYKNPYKQPRMK